MQRSLAASKLGCEAMKPILGVSLGVDIFAKEFQGCVCMFGRKFVVAGGAGGCVFFGVQSWPLTFLVVESKEAVKWELHVKCWTAVTRSGVSGGL